MKLMALSCNHCGGPLEVPTKVRYLTCNFCSSRLEVKKTDSAVFTEVLEALEEKTDQISDDVEILKLQNELLMLDRHWENKRERLCSRDQQGVLRVPRLGHAFGARVAGFLAGLALVVIGVMGGGATAAFLGAGVAALMWLIANSLRAKAIRYQKALSAYQYRRAKITSELRRLQLRL